MAYLKAFCIQMTDIYEMERLMTSLTIAQV